MNGAQWVVHALRTQGVDTVFGYPGGAIMPVYDALYDGGVEHLLCRHEQGAAMAAIGYARATGKTGVCIATSGPGATNLITGLADALLDSIPIVAITGQVAAPFIGTDAFQEVDVLGLSLACTKHSFLVQSLDELPRVIAEAFQVANSGRPGPVLVDIPKDIQMAQGDLDPHFSTVADEMAFPPGGSGAGSADAGPIAATDAVCWRRGRHGAGGTGFARIPGGDQDAGNLHPERAGRGGC